MITLLSNVAIQDTSNASNIVYLNNIMEGVDGAATFGYSLEPSSVKVDDNQTQQYLHDHTLDIRVLQGTASDLTKLKVIDANNNPVRVAGHSPDGFFVIDEPAQLTYHSQYDSVIADRVLVTTTGVNGYGGAAPGTKVPVYAGDNLLAVYKVNSGSSSYLNGFDTGLGGTVIGDTFSFTSTGTITGRSIFFPFPGLQISGFITKSGAGGTGTLTLEYLDDAGSSISTDTASIGAGTTTVSGTIPASTVSIRMKVTAASIPLSFRNPGIRLQGSSFSL
jgi:hypothetical protein